MNRKLPSVLAAAVLVGAWLAQTPAQAQVGSDNGSLPESPSDLRVPARTRAPSAAGNAQGRPSEGRPTAPGAGPLADGTTIRASLEKPVDARKSKLSDGVLAKTMENVNSGGQIVIPKGSRVVGHVTAIKMKGKGDPDSSVGIKFDRVVLKDGREIPLAMSIQALGAFEANSGDMENNNLMPDGGGTTEVPVQGAPSQFNGKDEITGAATNPTAKANSAGSAAGGASAGVSTGRLKSSTHGIVGIKGVTLNYDIAKPTGDPLIVSRSGNVHLDSGTNVILRVNGK